MGEHLISAPAQQRRGAGGTLCWAIPGRPDTRSAS
jgi:hypothetical protein